MFPYFDTTHWHAGVVEVEPFAILVTIAVAVGYVRTARRARRFGIPWELTSEFGVWLMSVGFLFTYLFALAYLPAELLDLFHHPGRVIHMYWGLSSFGGFAGGLLGAALFFRVRHIASPLRMLILDSLAAAVPFAWFFGRVACYLVHDHPAIRTTSWFGVRYPEGVRYDLGLLEALFLLALAGIFFLLDRVPHRPGFFPVLLFLSYGSFRLLEDPLHIDPPRYYGFTVDQFAAVAMISLGFVIFFKVYRCNISSCFRHVRSAVGSFGTDTR